MCYRSLIGCAKAVEKRSYVADCVDDSVRTGATLLIVRIETSHTHAARPPLSSRIAEIRNRAPRHDIEEASAEDVENLLSAIRSTRERIFALQDAIAGAFERGCLTTIPAR